MDARDDLRRRLTKATGNYNMYPGPSTAQVIRDVADELVQYETGLIVNGHSVSHNGHVHSRSRISIEESETEPKTGKTVYGTQSYDNGRIGP